MVDNEKEKVKESMTSAFIDYSRRFGLLTMQAGLRYEYIDFDYYNNDLYIAEQRQLVSVFGSLASCWQDTDATDVCHRHLSSKLQRA